MKQTVIICLIVALVFLSLGYLIGSASPINCSSRGNTFAAGWKAAKARLAESGIVPENSVMKISSIYGAVEKVKGKSILIKIKPLEPLADPNLDLRSVITDDDTRTFFLTQKNPSVYQLEMAEFDKKIQELTKNPIQPGGEAMAELIAPEIYNKEPVNLSEIQVGDKLNIISKAEDIKNTKQFRAAEILIQPR